MRIYVEPGTIVRVGPRSLSTKGGVFDVSRLSEKDRERILAIEGVSEFEDRYPRVEPRDAPGWFDVLIAPGVTANESALRRGKADELLDELEG